jgi:hypothetical protein
MVPIFHKIEKRCMSRLAQPPHTLTKHDPQTTSLDPEKQQHFLKEGDAPITTDIYRHCLMTAERPQASFIPRNHHEIEDHPSSEHVLLAARGRTISVYVEHGERLLKVGYFVF